MGALDFEIQHIRYYGAKGNDGILKSIDEVYGRIFYAEIKALASMPNFEIEKYVFLGVHLVIEPIPMRIPCLLDWLLAQIMIDIF